MHVRVRFSEIENVDEQHLVITVFDSDRGEIPGMKTIVQEKRGVSRCVESLLGEPFLIVAFCCSKLRSIRTLFTTGEIEDDFLGQLTLDIKVARCLVIDRVNTLSHFAFRP